MLLLAGCSSLRGTGDLEYVPGEGNVVEVAAGDREGPVSVSGDTVDGGTLDLADLRGQVAVVNVWWSGCGPCRTEMPMLVDVAERAPDDVAVVGINVRDSSIDSARTFEREFGVDYPSIFDQSGQSLIEFGRYTPNAQPSTVVLDEEGRVAALISGAIPSEQTLVDVVDEVAGEPVLSDG